MNNNGERKDTVCSFKASRGWFERFKRRKGLHNLKIIGEAAGAVEACIEFEDQSNSQANNRLNKEETGCPLSSHVISECLVSIEECLNKLSDNDPDPKRGQNVKRKVMNELGCYQKMLDQKKKEQLNDDFVRKNIKLKT